MIGVAPFIFQNPKTIRPDPINLQVAAWVVHEGPIDVDTGQTGSPGEGAVSLLVERSQQGQIPLTATSRTRPCARSRCRSRSVGEDRLSGVPVDIAFDNLRNLRGLVNFQTPFTSGAPSPQNSKGIVRAAPAIRGVSAARFAFSRCRRRPAS